MKITVLMGGLSPERNVSLSSGSLIAAALRRRGHEVLTLDLYVGVPENTDDVSSLFTKEQQKKLKKAISHFSLSESQIQHIEAKKAKRRHR